MRPTNPKYILLLCGATLLAASCSEDIALTQENAHALKLETVTLDDAGSTTTRAPLTEVNRIGIYVTKTADNTPYPSNPSSVYTLSGSTWSAENPPQITGENGAAKVYAYYPSDLTVANNSSGGHTVTISVVTADDFKATGQNDYLVTGKYVKGQEAGNGMQVAPLSVTSTNRSISIPMVHTLAKVSLRVLKSEAATEKLTLKKVEILSPTNRMRAGNGTMNLGNGKLELPNISILTLTGEAVLATNSTAPNVTCLAAPMAEAEPLLSFRLTVTVQMAGSDTGTDLIFETGVVATPQKWEACKHYTYKVTVDKMGGGLSGMQMDDWQNDASQNTNIGI